MIAERQRGLSKRDRTLRQRRRKRFVDAATKRQRRQQFADAAREHADSPGCLFADPDYHMAKAVGLDVARRELRVPEPPCRYHTSGIENHRQSLWSPNPHFDAAAKSPVPSSDCAAWRWWKALAKDDQDDLYDLSMPSHGYADGESQGVVPLTSRLTDHVDPNSVKDWGRE